ncbi:MAG: hypothetical protein LBF22_03235 [Deltaproteobacteria bacterium]|nr:hypothetical protein [Deltaproteobacteria bacterium]
MFKNTTLAPLLGLLVFILAFATPLWAQMGNLGGPEKKQLLAIAREPITAALEGRSPRSPSVGPALQAAHPLVVSFYLDGKLYARGFELENPGPLFAQAMALTVKLLNEPNWGTTPPPEILPQLKIGLAVLHRFLEIPDDKALNDMESVIILNGFNIGVAVPSDLPPGGTKKDLFTQASLVAGLRPGAWLLPDSTLISSPTIEAME